MSDPVNPDHYRRHLSPITASRSRPDRTWRGRPIRSTSELLFNAISELDFAYPGNKHAVIVHLQHDLADRAAQLQAEGD